MAIKYADRAFLSINGQEIIDVRSATLRRSQNRQVVQTMTRDGYNKGFTEGNEETTVDFTVGVRAREGLPKLNQLDFEANEVAIVFECGAERVLCIGGWIDEHEISASGVGSEADARWTFHALKTVDENGSSVTDAVVLGAQAAGGVAQAIGF